MLTVERIALIALMGWILLSRFKIADLSQAGHLVFPTHTLELAVTYWSVEA